VEPEKTGRKGTLRDHDACRHPLIVQARPVTALYAVRLCGEDAAARLAADPRRLPPFHQFEAASSERIDMRAEFEGGRKGSADARCLLTPIRT
jgi:hypothetical protein